MIASLLSKYEANGLSDLEDEWTRQYQVMLENAI